MAQAALTSDRTCCIRCGNPYRPPIWGRDYLCPVCANPLHGAQRRAMQRLSPWLLAAIVPLLLLGGVARLAAARPFRMANGMRGIQTGAPPQPPRMPRAFRRHLLQKAEFLKADLRRKPDSVVLLARLAETYLFLAVLERDRSGSEVGRWQQEALRVTRQLRRVSPDLAAQLDVDIL
ncbi:MAG: hypothetical protein FJX77_08135, partial [Armatimonadetes bacterium]|nr:hypothetical protein [Armatimonadota bacterium]